MGMTLHYESHGLLVFSRGGPSFHLKHRKLEDDIGLCLLYVAHSVEAVTH